MNINFTGAQFLSYSHENRFIGEGPFRIGGVKNLSIESFIDERYTLEPGRGESGVRDTQSTIQRLILASHNFENIVINNHDFGPGRITSASFPTDVGTLTNAVRLSKNTYNIEIRHSGEGDLHNLSDGQYLDGVYGALSGHAFIDSIGESFSFQTNADESYSYTHNVNIGYVSGLVEDPIVKSRALASGLFNSASELGFLDSKRAGFYDNDGHKVFSEAYSLLDGKCSFTKTFNSLSFYGLNDAFSHGLTHSIRSNERGIISITENANIMGKETGPSALNKNLRNESMKAGMDTLLEQAQPRCESIFNHYSGFYGSEGKPSHGVVSGLNGHHISLNKNFNEQSAEGSYNIVFNNDYSISGSGQHNYTLSLNSSNEIISVSEEGSIVRFDTRRSTSTHPWSDPIQLLDDFNINTAMFDDNGNLTNLPAVRCGEFYSGSMYRDKQLNPTKETMSFSKSGKSIQYGRDFTDDERIVNTRGVKKIDLNVSDRYTTPTHTAYFIPNQEKQILHERGLHTLSSRDIRVSANIERPSLNPYNNVSVLPIHRGEAPTNVPEALQYVVDTATLEAYRLGVTEGNTGIFLADINYGINSENNLGLNMTVSYLQD